MLLSLRALTTIVFRDIMLKERIKYSFRGCHPLLIPAKEPHDAHIKVCLRLLTFRAGNIPVYLFSLSASVHSLLVVFTVPTNELKIEEPALCLAFSRVFEGYTLYSVMYSAFGHLRFIVREFTNGIPID